MTYTAHDLRSFYDDVVVEDPAYDPRLPSERSNPFAWDPDRRAHLRAELDAYYAMLYGLTRDELRYILDPKGAELHLRCGCFNHTVSRCPRDHRHQWPKVVVRRFAVEATKPVKPINELRMHSACREIDISHAEIRQLPVGKVRAMSDVEPASLHPWGRRAGQVR